MAGLSLDGVHKVEKGYRAPGLLTIVKLAYGLGVDPDELVARLRPQRMQALPQGKRI